MANRLDVSDNTAISMPMRNLLSIITAVAIGVWAYFGVLERITMLETKAALAEKDLNQAVEMLTTDLEKNTEFRIKWPRGEMGALPADAEQFMLIEHLAGELEKLSTDIEQGKAPFDQQQALTLNFFETRINKLEKQIDDLKDKIVNNHYEAVKKNGH